MSNLLKIQYELNAPKNLYNSFGKYKYRNVEGILIALKPLLLKYNCSLVLTDSIEQIGDRFYVKATARVKDIESGDVVESVGYAREENEKKGMDASMLTGSCSSYARKYALNGLFLIDDSKDSDDLSAMGNGTEKAKREMKYLTDAQFNAAIKKHGVDKYLEKCESAGYIPTESQIKSLDVKMQKAEALLS